MQDAVKKAPELLREAGVSEDKKFAAGCSREVISQGAERLGWELEELFDKTIQAMRSCEASVAEAMANNS